jgi:hypothetical protein
MLTVLNSIALNGCPPPIAPCIARTSWTGPKIAGPAQRATEARLPPSRPPCQRAFLARSLFLTANAAARLSYVLRGGLVPQVGLYGKVLLVTVLVLRYAHHFPHPACHHMIILSLTSPPPLLPCLSRPFPPTYNPPDPSFFTALKALRRGWTPIPSPFQRSHSQLRLLGLGRQDMHRYFVQGV